MSRNMSSLFLNSYLKDGGWKVYFFFFLSFCHVIFDEKGKEAVVSLLSSFC